MTDTLEIALNKLSAWKGNVRKTGAKDGIDELAASIATHGLLQSLVVRPTKGDEYEVIAGRRRYLALQSLAKSGRLRKDQPIACTLANDAIDATELSLAENVIRAPMHPADQFEAFRMVIDGGATVSDVAARFGVEEGLVAKRLKLGRLSPVILKAYRDGEIALEEAQAFALSDDHEAQERVFTELPEWNRSAHLIRRSLTQSEVPASDKRVRFLGLDVYEAAGGPVRRDLFDDHNGGYVQDIALLDRLVSEKLADTAQQLRAEGWAWVETAIDLDYATLAAFSQRDPDRAELNGADRDELDRLTGEYDASVDDDESDSEYLSQLQERIDAIMAASEHWSPETLSVAGAMVGLGHNGELRIERGLLREADEPRLGADDTPQDEGVRVQGGLSSKLIEDLTAQKSAAISAELMRRPDVALAAVVHASVLQTFYLGSSTDSALKLAVHSAGVRQAMASPDLSAALAAIDQERAKLEAALPEPETLWAWCGERSQDELLRMLAVMAAISVDAVQRKADRPDAARLSHAGQLADALSLDMRSWFVPGAENYFGRIKRADILAAIDEAKGPHAPALDKLKKTELALRAEDLIANSGWLPELLRPNDDAAA